MARSRKLQAVDDAIAARARAIVEQMDRAYARAQQMLQEAREKDLERTLLKALSEHPLAATFEMQKLIAALQGLDRAGAARSKAEHRRAEIIRMSLAGIPVGQMAKELGLSYDYVVQLRAKLGLSTSRKRR
jgi:hypothetical protein